MIDTLNSVNKVLHSGEDVIVNRYQNDQKPF